MPKPHPKEFRDDVVRVAQQREDGVTIKHVAKDFGISESCLTNWIAIADREAGIRPGPTVTESVELRDAKRRIRLLEQEKPSPLGHPPGPAYCDRHQDRTDLPPAPPTHRLGRLTPIECEATMATPAYPCSRPRLRTARTRRKCCGHGHVALS